VVVVVAGNRLIRRRTAEAGVRIKRGCHVFRATGITAYLEAGGTLENAQALTAFLCGWTRRDVAGPCSRIAWNIYSRIQVFLPSHNFGSAGKAAEATRRLSQ
jgi:hypothetical protein